MHACVRVHVSVGSRYTPVVAWVFEWPDRTFLSHDSRHRTHTRQNQELGANAVYAGKSFRTPAWMA